MFWTTRGGFGQGLVGSYYWSLDLKLQSAYSEFYLLQDRKKSGAKTSQTIKNGDASIHVAASIREPSSFMHAATNQDMVTRFLPSMPAHGHEHILARDQDPLMIWWGRACGDRE